MEIVFGVLAVIGGLCGLLGYILLVVAGFKRSVTWGLVNLLVPFGALVFVIKYWDEGKLGFLLSVVAFVVNIGLAIMLGTQMMPMMDEEAMRALQAEQHRQLMEQARQTGQAGEAAPAAQDRVGSGNSTASSPADAQAPVAATPAAPPRPPPPRFEFRETDVDFLQASVGQPVKVETRGGREHSGVLRGVNDDLVRVEVRMSGGKAEFNILKSDIARVLVREQVQ